MTEQKIKDKVKEIIAKVLNCKVEEIVEQGHIIKKLGADSLDIVDIIVTIEEEFQTELPCYEELEKVASVNRMVNYLLKQELDWKEIEEIKKEAA